MTEIAAVSYAAAMGKKEGRLCFVIPPSVFLLDERVFMTLGILRVAAVVEEKGYPLDMLDLSGIQNYVEVVRDYLNGHDTTTFCLTATTPQMPAVCAIADVIRQQRPHARADQVSQTPAGVRSTSCRWSGRSGRPDAVRMTLNTDPTPSSLFTSSP